MKDIMRKLKRFLLDEDGSQSLEYAALTCVCGGSTIYAAVQVNEMKHDALTRCLASQDLFIAEYLGR